MTVMIEILYIWRFEAAGAPKVRVMIWGGAFWNGIFNGIGRGYHEYLRTFHLRYA
jgi:hypothetical protein